MVGGKVDNINTRKFVNLCMNDPHDTIFECGKILKGTYSEVCLRYTLSFLNMIPECWWHKRVIKKCSDHIFMFKFYI